MGKKCLKIRKRNWVKNGCFCRDEERCWIFNVASGAEGYHVAVDVLDLDLGSGDTILLTDGRSNSLSFLY